MRKVGYDATDTAVKKLLDTKAIEGKFSEQIHFNKNAAIYGGLAAGVVGAAVVVGVGYYAYDKGREQGQLDMVDAKVTFESHGKR